MDDCLFCGFAKSDSPVPKVKENEFAYVIKDINPQAPVHLLIIPKAHLENAAALAIAEPLVVAELFKFAGELAKENHLSGYRTVFNTGASAGQSVFHAHLHLLGGRDFQWPPG
jgi:histidine triad (HIT) family protein